MSLFSRFRKNERGNVAILFGLAVTPAIMGMGLAVDYSRVSNARTEMQAAVDAAAVAAARAAVSMDDGELEEYASAFFKQNLGQPTFQFDNLETSRDGRAVVVKGAGTLHTSLMAIVPGYETLPVKAEARVEWKSTKIEVALVLDNTGSMGEQNRLRELKKAATNFVNILESTSYGSDSVRISVVPFSTRVMLEADTYRDARWLRFEQGVSKRRWQGCLDEREQPYNTNMATPVPHRDATLYLGTSCAGFEHLAPVTRLTDNYEGIRQTISEMQAVGYTNITLGTHWGEITLAEGGLFGDGAPKTNTEIQKYMIVLTDGANTRNRFGDNVWKMNRDTLAACQSAKNAGIKLYTILLVEGDENMLRNCASSDSTFTYVSSASQLDSAFRGIAEEIGNIRLTN